MRRAGEAERGFVRLVPVQVSEAERGLATTYRTGDVIQFHQNGKGGYVKGQRLTVGDPAAGNLAVIAVLHARRSPRVIVAILRRRK